MKFTITFVQRSKNDFQSVINLMPRHLRYVRTLREQSRVNRKTSMPLARFYSVSSLRRCISPAHLSQSALHRRPDLPIDKSFSRHSKVAAQLFFPPFRGLPFSLHSRHNLLSLSSFQRERAAIISYFTETKTDRYFLARKGLRTIRDPI